LVGSLLIHLHLPGCASLKEKRGRIIPLMSRMRREFNLSVAETDMRDAHQEAIIQCAMVNSDATELHRSLQGVARWVAGNWPDGDLIATKIEAL
jgi:uncharacterized protein YlxP (DUF503 family)